MRSTGHIFSGLLQQMVFMYIFKIPERKLTGAARTLLFCGLLFAVVSVVSCSAPGPVVPPWQGESVKPAVLPKRLFFEPSHPFFRHLNAGAVYFKKIRRRGTQEHLRTDFRMQVLGQMADGSVRLRSFEGTALQSAQDPDLLELDSQRCYTFAKRFWEDRLRPIERWTCDHLVFRFQRDGALAWKTLRDERSLSTEYLGNLRMEAPAILQKQHYFSGRLIALSKLIKQDRRIETKTETKLAPLDKNVTSKIADADLLIWSKDAGSLLRDGQTLSALDQDGNTLGRLRVLSRPGDFVLARWITPPSNLAVYAYTNQSRTAGPGLF